MKHEILAEFNAVTGTLLQLLASADSETFNKAPSEGSWTPAQVASHLFLSDSSLLKSLKGPVQATTRKADEYVPGLRDAFLDFSTKMISPDIIVPENMMYDKQGLIKDIAITRAQIKEVIENADLSATCLFVEVKALGSPTRLELIHFIIVHTQRHIHQWKNIMQALMLKA